MKTDYVKNYSKAWSNTNNKKRKATGFLKHTHKKKPTSIYLGNPKSAETCSMLQ